jgi:hypothetical protein
MWKTMVIPAAAAAALTSPASAATTLQVQTTSNSGWTAVTPGIPPVVIPTVVQRNAAWANTSWLSTAASGESGVATGTYSFIYSLRDAGRFDWLSGLLYADNRLLSIFVNNDRTKGVTFDPNSNGGEFQFLPTNGRQILLDLSKFGDISSITFEVQNDSGAQGISMNLSSSVPEPGTWMLMILGLGAVGFAMRRRQSTTVRHQFA